MSPVTASVQATQQPLASGGGLCVQFGWKSWTKIRFDSSSVSSLPVHNREFGRLLEYLCVFMALHHVILLLAHTHSIAARIPCTFLRTIYPIVPFCQNRVPQIDSASLHACILSFEEFGCQVSKIGSLTPYGLLKEITSQSPVKDESRCGRYPVVAPSPSDHFLSAQIRF